METFFAVIFFIFLFFYLLQLGLRLFLRRKIRKIQRDMQNGGGQGFYKQYSWGQGSREQKSNHSNREGEIRVDTRTAPDKKINDRIGDYVDFEEIE